MGRKLGQLRQRMAVMPASALTTGSGVHSPSLVLELGSQSRRRVLAANSEEREFQVKPLLQLSRSSTVFLPIVGANLVVYGLWQTMDTSLQSKPVNRLLSVVFMTSPNHWRNLAWYKAPLHWIGSSFSHVGLLHLGVNMFALQSFSRGLIDPSPYNSPRMSIPLFLATYFTGGMTSGLVSNMWGTILRSPGER